MLGGRGNINADIADRREMDLCRVSTSVDAFPETCVEARLDSSSLISAKVLSMVFSSQLVWFDGDAGLPWYCVHVQMLFSPLFASLNFSLVPKIGESASNTLCTIGLDIFRTTTFRRRERSRMASTAEHSTTAPPTAIAGSRWAWDMPLVEGDPCADVVGEAWADDDEEVTLKKLVVPELMTLAEV
jgi:hypothetical protein